MNPATTGNRPFRLGKEKPGTAHAPGAAWPWTSRICEHFLLKTFEHMPAGCLEMTLPDGRIRRFGRAPSPTARMHIVSPAFFGRCIRFGDVGFGESFVDGQWETDDLGAVLSWFIENVETVPFMSGSRARPLTVNLMRVWNRLQHRRRANTIPSSERNIREHYDLGNEFYSLWLDPTMTYSSARFDQPGLTLEQAQTAKYEALCRHLRLAPSDHVLEIGSGWGGFASHAARTHGCRVTTLTVSPAQLEFARDRFRREGIADRVEIRLEDYRKARGQFDKIASIEMLEAVGDQYIDTYFSQCHALLKRDGLLGLQYIACPDQRYDSFRRGVDWIQKHIFPGSLLPSTGRINQALNRTGDLGLFHLEDFGASYAETLRQWRGRFESNWNSIRALGFDETFRRKWRYYLNYCEAAFARHNITVVQAFYTRPNNPRFMRA